MQPFPVIALTPGEPAGIGPDLVVQISQQEFDAALVVVADPELIRSRAKKMGVALELEPLRGKRPQPGRLYVHPVPLSAPVEPGVLNPENAAYVLETIKIGAKKCSAGSYDALVTGPIHKGVINDSGRQFTGHTEYLAELTGGLQPVMLFVAKDLFVALLTTHLPLSEVPQAITRQRIESVIQVLDRDLREKFAIASPRIHVCGLNPHAGESGHLGKEEMQVLIPAIEGLKSRGYNLLGPLPADTAFLPNFLDKADVTLAMYHDQGLPVVKHYGFGEAVNVTLGLPIVRTSVDHGTALDLAGSGMADSGSLSAALGVAISIVKKKLGAGAGYDQSELRSW
ncbi:4-hydroxythreonine-4-phosphate dehydrogenase PdxA [Pseudomonadota bacterium]